MKLSYKSLTGPLIRFRCGRFHWSINDSCHGDVSRDIESHNKAFVSIRGRG